MDVEAAERRHLEQPRRQDEAVGGNDDGSGRRVEECVACCSGIVGEAAVEAQATGLGDRYAARQSQRLDR